ncbi:hypothetical protein GCM10027155_06750 [Acinetobacter apis]|uniref:Recombinase-like domain-containing protein n=1 Tax=Acinetobacter apis TaxID=1229165 RepID=A0A217EE16_9GAMM|nr:recombinase-like helix-turn-helix domain-containing protein [Acinetobacter apis]SNQ28759.1 hypothetical protein SAMN05444584_0684 [Acinetobacter apis]
MNDFNQKLAFWQAASPSKEAGINNIQIPGKIDHIIWQTRYKTPTAYELDLVNALISAFSKGITDLEPLVASLNEQGLRQESGEVWTSASFQTEMQRLGY